MRLVRPGKGTANRAVRAWAAVGIVILGVLGLLGWAWIDGGREPLREIVQPIPVPEQAR